MKKDVIYIDVEDDITAIIEKLKASKAKIVALVPPKRSTVLTSAVNTKLLKRAAKDTGKRVVLITSDAALLTIAGGLGLHAAKNLQSKPYLPEAPETPVGEDNVIEGDLSDLDPKTAVGDLAGVAVVGVTGAATVKNKDKKSDDDKETKGADTGKKDKKLFKIPNFEGFRLKIILGAVGVVLLTIGWWWAFWIAPVAEVNIMAQTSQLDTAIDYTADTKIAASDLEKQVLKGAVKEMKKTITENFTATGEKNVGKKASGTITISNCDYPDPGVTFAPGTQFTASGYTYVSTEPIFVTGFTGPASACSGASGSAGVGSGNIVATAPGGEYNRDPSESYSISGESSALSGTVASWDVLGTTEVKKVVSQEDFDKAKANLATRDYSKEKQEIVALFGDELIGMEETFEFKIGKVTSAPAVGQPGEKSILSAEITFTEVGIASSDLGSLLKEFQEPKIDTSTQSIYDNGLSSATYELQKELGSGKYSFRLRTIGTVGPNIDTDALGAQIEGKRFSEAKSIVDAIPGVVSSEIKLSPFWVNKVPSISKTTINVEISEQNLQ